MKISEVIEFLSKAKQEHGDLELFCFAGDGRCSWVEPYKPKLEYTNRWPLKKNQYLWVVK